MAWNYEKESLLTNKDSFFYSIINFSDMDKVWTIEGIKLDIYKEVVATRLLAAVMQPRCRKNRYTLNQAPVERNLHGRNIPGYQADSKYFAPRSFCLVLLFCAKIGRRYAT
jgi:hypothetical protein